MKEIRILMCGSARKEKGGMSSVVEQLMNHEWGHDIKLSYLATHISGNVLKKTVYFLLAYIKLHYLIARDKFDIIHVHMSYKGSFKRKYLVSKLCKKKNKKVILHLHGSEFKKFYLEGSEKLKKQIVELFTIVDRAVLLGENWQNFILSIAPNAKTVVINNAVQIPDYKKNYKSDENRFLFMGALIKRKGVEDLILASKNLINSNISNFVVFIAGSGEEETYLKKLVKSNDLSGNIKFLGWIDGEKKEKLLQYADVMVLPSYNEGLPVAIIEAMSYGMPVISTTVGSISEAVKNGVNGFLMKSGDIQSLKDSMEKLINDNDLYCRMAKQSRAICEEKFSDKLFFEKVLNVYYDVI